MSRRWSQPTECGKPKWRETKRGRRCAAVCEDGRWKFVKKSACAGGKNPEEESSGVATSPEVEEFSGAARPMKGVLAPLAMEPIQPMPLFPLVGPGSSDRPRRRGRRRNG